MKKLVLLVILIPKLSWAVTASDIPTIKNLSNQIDLASQDLRSFSLYISNLSDQNFTFTVGFSTDTLSLTNQQKTNLINKYNAKKAALQGLVNQLP